MFTSKFLSKAAAVMAVLTITLNSAQPALAAPFLDNTVNRDVAFQAQLHHFSMPVGPCEDGVCNLVSYGYGTVNIMGSPFVAVTVNFVWDFNTTPCSTLDPLEFVLVGETGSITISGLGSICSGSNSQLGFPEFFSGVGEIISGTGEFSGITGTVTSKGTLGPNGPVVHMSGNMLY